MRRRDRNRKFTNFLYEFLDEQHNVFVLVYGFHCHLGEKRHLGTRNGRLAFSQLRQLCSIGGSGVISGRVRLLMYGGRKHLRIVLVSISGLIMENYGYYS